MISNFYELMKEKNIWIEIGWKLSWAALEGPGLTWTPFSVSWLDLPTIFSIAILNLKTVFVRQMNKIMCPNRTNMTYLAPSIDLIWVYSKNVRYIIFGLFEMLLTQACTEPIIISIQPTIVEADMPKNNPKLPPTSETKRF